MRIVTNIPPQMTEEEYNSVLFGLFNIIFTNDVCTGYVYDVLEAVKKAGLMKKGVKYRANILRAEIKKYNKVLGSLTKDKEFIADINECYEDIISADKAKLDLTVSNFMHKCHVPYVDVQSKTAIAYIFAQGACRNVDENIKRRKDVQRFTKNYNMLKLESLLEALKRLMEELEKIFKADHYFCDLNDSNDIFNGFVIITRKLADPHTIVKVVDKYDKAD